MESLYEELKSKALKIRRNIVNMIYLASSGHPGGALSITDVLTVLYFTEMNVDPLNPKMKTEIDLFYQKDMLLLRYMQHLQKEDL